MNPEIKLDRTSGWTGFTGMTLIYLGFGYRLPWASGSSPPLTEFEKSICCCFGFGFLFLSFVFFIHKLIQKIVSDRLENEHVRIRNSSYFNDAYFDEQNKLIELKRKKQQKSKSSAYPEVGTDSTKKSIN